MNIAMSVFKFIHLVMSLNSEIGFQNDFKILLISVIIKNSFASTVIQFIKLI